MDMHTGLSILSGVLILIAFPLYVRACQRGETKPVKATWLVFASLDSIALAGMMVENTVNGQILASVLVGWGSFYLACRYGISGWSLNERLCLAGAGAAPVLWWWFGAAEVGIVISMLVMVLGCLPMLIETIKDPSKEDPNAWCVYGMSCVAALGAIPEWSFASATQPVAFALVEVTMAVITWRYKLRMA